MKVVEAKLILEKKRDGPKSIAGWRRRAWATRDLALLEKTSLAR